MKSGAGIVRAVSILLCSLIAAGSFPNAALAQGAPGASAAYPAKPIRIVVAFPPGGSNDIVARIAAQRMNEAWGQTVIVENRPGANTIIASELVAKSPADGYTLLVGATSTYTVNPQIYAKLPYDPVRDLAPVTMLGSHPLIIVINAGVPAMSLTELIALAKSRPGDLNYGTSSVTFQVAVESFSQSVGIRMNHIPYKGSVPTAIAVAAGDIQLAFIDPAPVLPHLRSGKIRALAITSAQRASYLPDLPTQAQAGLSGPEIIFWLGLFTPAGTPRDIIGRLQVESGRALHDPKMRERLAGVGIDPVANTPEEFVEYLKAEAARYAPAIKAANIRGQ